MMKQVIATIILLIASSAVFAQTETTFKDCRVSERTPVETTAECKLDGKPIELRFPTTEFWFGSQCAVADTEFSRWEVANGKVYDPPFTLIAGEYGWRYERKPYSLCEMALHQTRRSCVGADTPHDIPRWQRCPAQNTK